jgi:hypothetical protein
MKRSVQEIIELAVFGLIALLIGTGFLWVAGWILGGLGWLLQIVAQLVWSLLRFIVPVAVAAGLVYLLVRSLQGRARKRPVPVPEPVGVPGPSPAVAERSGTGVRVFSTPPGAAPGAQAAYDPDDSWHPPVEPAVDVDEPAPGTDVALDAGADGPAADSSSPAGPDSPDQDAGRET